MFALLWANPLARKITLGIAAAILLFTIVKMWEHHVALTAANKEAARELEDKDKILKQERSETQSKLLSLQQQRTEAEQREKQTQVALRGLTQQLASIANQRVLDREAINKISDDKLASDVRQRVGLHPSDSLTFSVSEIRVVDETLSALPTMKAEISTLQDSDKQRQIQVEALKAQLSAQQGQLQSVLQYNTRLEESYRQAYLVAQKFRRRSWFVPIISFGLVHRERKIDLPSPLQVKAATP